MRYIYIVRNVFHNLSMSGKRYSWFILMLVLNCYFSAQAQNIELISELKKIDDSILDVTGVSLGTLAVLAKYEEGSYYPEWLLKERRDISRLESLKENDIIFFEIHESIGNPKAEGPFYRIVLTKRGQQIHQILQNQ